MLRRGLPVEYSYSIKDSFYLKMCISFLFFLQKVGGVGGPLLGPCIFPLFIFHCSGAHIFEQIEISFSAWDFMLAPRDSPNSKATFVLCEAEPILSRDGNHWPYEKSSGTDGDLLRRGDFHTKVTRVLVVCRFWSCLGSLGRKVIKYAHSGIA